MKPILFKGPMVQAILEGRKTQTRWPIVLPPWMEPPGEDGDFEIDSAFDNGNRVPWPQAIAKYSGCLAEIKCPYGQPGTRLWVREATWMLNGQFQNPYVKSCEHPLYCATDAEPQNIGLGIDWIKRPSIHMPRWASRITLEVVDVRVERVQEITEHNARAEGIDNGACWQHGHDRNHFCQDSSVKPFAVLWDSIFAKRGFGWDANPWVWCVSFGRID